MHLLKFQLLECHTSSAQKLGIISVSVKRLNDLSLIEMQSTRCTAVEFKLQ